MGSTSLYILPRQCSPQPVGVESGSFPAAAALAAHPDPFNPSTTLSFAVPSTGRTSLAIYDAQGREVVTLVDKEARSGHASPRLDRVRCRRAPASFGGLPLPAHDARRGGS
jgi:hypothetical protein